MDSSNGGPTSRLATTTGMGLPTAPLRLYLIFLTLATLLPLAIFASVVGYLLVAEQRETFRRGAEERTLAVLTAVDKELEGSISTLQALATLHALDQGDLTAVRRRAAAVLSDRPNWININLALPDGQQVMNLQVPAGQPLPNIGQLDGSFERLRQTGQPVVSDLAMGPVLKRLSFAVRVPFIREGRIQYVLSAGISADAISSIIKRQNLPDSWVGVIVDRNGRIVARNFDPGRQGELASQSLRDALARADNGWFHGATLGAAWRAVRKARRAYETRCRGIGPERAFAAPPNADFSVRPRRALANSPPVP